MKMEKPQNYTAAFRESSVKLALESDQPIKTITDGLGVMPSTLRT